MCCGVIVLRVCVVVLENQVEIDEISSHQGAELNKKTGVAKYSKHMVWNGLQILPLVLV